MESQGAPPTITKEQPVKTIPRDDRTTCNYCHTCPYSVVYRSHLPVYMYFHKVGWKICKFVLQIDVFIYLFMHVDVL